MNPRFFRVTAQHIALLRHARLGWDGCEFGAPAINCKRPYGNSTVIDDIGEILNIEPEGWDEEWDEKAFSDEQKAMMERLHKETETALEIVLRTGTFEPGVYVADRYRSNWRRAREKAAPDDGVTSDD